MAQSTKIASLIEELEKQENYTFGKAWHGKESLALVVPILLKGSAGKREYVLVDEVKDKIEFQDSGELTKVYAKGDIDQPVFVRSGMVLEGKGTQSRVVVDSKIIMPENKRISLEVRCVHKSHFISGGSNFTIGHQAPIGVHKSVYSKSQTKIWASVSAMSKSSSHSTRTHLRRIHTSYEGECFGMGNIGTPMMAASNSLSDHIEELIPEKDSLIGILNEDSYAKTLNKFIREMPSLENQVGIVVIDPSGVLGLELFDHPDSWKAASAGVIEKYGEAFTKPAKTPFKLSVDEATIPGIISAFLKLIITSGMSDEHGTHELVSNEVYGEYTVLNKQIIHIIALRKDESERTPKPTPDSLGSIISSGTTTAPRSETYRASPQYRTSPNTLPSYRLRGGRLQGGRLYNRSPSSKHRIMCSTQVYGNEKTAQLAKEGSHRLLMSGFNEELLGSLDSFAIKHFPSRQGHKSSEMAGNRSKAARYLIAEGLVKQGYF